jgi:hypothetical protein
MLAAEVPSIQRRKMPDGKIPAILSEEKRQRYLRISSGCNEKRRKFRQKPGQSHASPFFSLSRR